MTEIQILLSYFLDLTYELEFSSLIEEGCNVNQVVNAIENAVVRLGSLQLEHLKKAIKEGKLRLLGQELFHRIINSLQCNIYL